VSVLWKNTALLTGFFNTDAHGEECKFSELLLPKYLNVKTFFFLPYSAYWFCQVRDMQIATAET